MWGGDAAIEDDAQNGASSISIEGGGVKEEETGLERGGACNSLEWERGGIFTPKIDPSFA